MYELYMPTTMAISLPRNCVYLYLFLPHQPFQRCIHLSINPYLQIPALLQLHRFIKYVQPFDYHMFDISRQFYIVFNWVFDRVVERWEKYRKILPLLHLLYLILKLLKVKSVRSPSVLHSMLIKIFPIQMKSIHRNNYWFLKYIFEFLRVGRFPWARNTAYSN